MPKSTPSKVLCLFLARQLAVGPWDRRTFPSALLLSLLLGALILPARSGDENHIAIYAPNTNYPLPVTDRQGREYVGLLEVIESLGNVSSRSDGLHWRLRYKDVDAEFTNGQKRAKIHGHDVDLVAPFLLENGRGLVPVSSLGSV